LPGRFCPGVAPCPAPFIVRGLILIYLSRLLLKFSVS